MSIAIGVILILILSAILVWRNWPTLRRIRWRLPWQPARPRPPRNAAAPTVRGRHLPPPRRPLLKIIRDEAAARGKAGGFILFLFVLVCVLLAINVAGRLGADEPSRNLVIALAPFTGQDGQRLPEGASAARELVQEWSQGADHRLTRPLQFLILEQPITSPEAALQIAQSQGADAVLWGWIEPGGSADSASLHPSLLWAPRAPAPIQQWPTGRDRLSLPPLYELASAPLNGQAVLGRLFEVLDLYQLGEYDAAISGINVLLDGYAATNGGPLRPDLLYGLRGAIRWSQEQWSAAEADFQQAIAAAPGRPEYWNNLGVVLLAQGRSAEGVQALNRAEQAAAAGGVAVAAIHLNRGLLILRGQDPAAALPDLTRAKELLPQSPAVLTALAQAQRRSNQLDAASESINGALGLAADDPLVQLEAGRLRLALLVQNGLHTEWEFEIAPPLPQEPLAAARGNMDAATQALEQLVLRERQQSASADAAGRPEEGRVHEGQSRQLAAALSEARFWQAVALTEEGLAASRNQPGGVKRLWDGLFGEDTPLEQSQQKLAAYTRQFEGDYDSRVLFGRVNRLIGQPKLALEQYVRATELAPERPEGWYGTAIVRWEAEAASPERDAQVREALARALALDPNYAPAHYAQARVELAGKQWAAALPPLQWLHARRPADDTVALELGRTQRQLNLLPEAEQTLLPLANAGHGPALVELALAYAQAQRFDSAEAVLRRSLDLDAGNAVAAYELGRLLQSQGKFPEAEQAYLAAIGANPAYMEAHLALGQLYGRVMNRSDLAVESYRRAIEAGGSDARNFEDLGQEFLEMGQYEEAATALERSIALNPNVPESQHALGQAYLELGRFDMARERERAAIARKADGPYPAAQLGIAESFRREGRWEEATQAFNQVLDENPDLAAAYVGLGRTAASQLDWQGAIGYYNQALARDPDDTNAHFWMGQALIEQGFNERALDEFELVLRADPANVQAYYGAGRAHSRIAENLYGVDLAQAQRYDAEARRLLNEALARRPTYAAALLERGIINERQGLAQAALSDYAQAAAADGQLATAPYLQGKLQLSLNNVADATAALEDSVRRDPRNPQALYWLGRAYRAQNRPADAIKSLQVAIDLNKGYTEALYFLGLTQQESNLAGDARASYGAIVSQAPAEDRWRQQAEERLRELAGDQ